MQEDIQNNICVLDLHIHTHLEKMYLISSPNERKIIPATICLIQPLPIKNAVTM